MFLSKVRSQYEQQSKLIGKYLSKFGISPDGFTMLGTCCGLIAGILLWHQYFLWAVLMIVLSGLADMADGAVARFLNRQHPFGTVFDRVNDRYVEFFVAVGYIGSGRVHPAWVMFSLFGALMASYTRACAESAGKVKNCSVGIMERQEKAALVIIGMLLEPVLNPQGLIANSLNPFHYEPAEGILILQILIIVMGIFSHVTVYQRLCHAKQHENEM